MFNIELRFACDILMCWFNEKFKKPQTNLNNQVAIDYRRAFPITVETKCVICDFPIEVDPKGLEYKENNMSYLDFLIRKEYAFIRNIFDEDDLKQSKYMRSKNLLEQNEATHPFVKGKRDGAEISLFL